MTENLYAVAIFVSRESTERAMRTISGVLESALLGTVVDVLINGNPVLAGTLPHLCKNLPVPDGKRLRLWCLEIGDKANAWNQFVHAIFGGHEIVWFMDGYVTPAEDAFCSLCNTLERNPRALGASAIPTEGRSAACLSERMKTLGGLHGNLFCVRGEVIQRMLDDDVRLPLGVYWVDGIVGALLSFNLDPRQHEWDPGRISVDCNATWTTDGAGSFCFANAKIYLKRVLWQTKGKIENLAISQFLHKRRNHPSLLPRTTTELVQGWSKQSPAEVARSLGLHPLRRYAYRQILKNRNWALAAKPPELVLKLEAK